MGEQMYGWSKPQLWFNGNPLGFIEDTSVSNFNRDACCTKEAISSITDSITIFSATLTISTAEMKQLKLWFNRLATKRKKRVQFKQTSNRNRKKKRFTRLQRRRKRQLS